jgi:hypothetical protein
MRQEIYKIIRSCLLTSGIVNYVDLWNQNVEFIEQENNWPRPAVFVEFDPIKWERSKEGVMRTASTLKLHLVTDWTPNSLDADNSLLSAIELTRIIQNKLERLNGEKFGHMILLESHTNHNHEEIIETIDVYRYKGFETV